MRYYQMLDVSCGESAHRARYDTRCAVTLALTATTEQLPQNDSRPEVIPISATANAPLTAASRTKVR